MIEVFLFALALGIVAALGAMIVFALLAVVYAAVALYYVFWVCPVIIAELVREGRKKP